MKSSLISPVKKHIVLLIHGTNAADISNTGEQWWQRNSACWQYLNKELQENYDCQPEDFVFHWSGINSEKERRLAGRKLAKLLLYFEKKAQPYHLIGHSHGGSVIWHSIYSLTEKKIELSYIKSWATVGTPFLFYNTKKINLCFIIPIVLASAFLVYFFDKAPFILEVIRNIVNDPTGSIYPLVFLAIVSMIPLFIIIFGIIRLLLYFKIKRKLNIEAKAKELALRKYEGRYLGLWCNVDEAISGLSSTLNLGGQIVPRVSINSTPIKRIILLIITPFRLLYNKLIAQASDEFIWERLIKKLQGNDFSYFNLYKVSSSPILSYNLNDELSIDIKSKLIEEANKNAAQTVASVRNILGLGATSTSSKSLVAGLTQSIKFNELIHTSYFDNEDIRNLLIKHILEKSLDTFQNIHSPITKGLNYGTKDESEYIHKSKFRALPFMLNSIACLIIILTWTFSTILYDNFVYPFTEEYQVKYIASQNISARIVEGGDLPEYALTQLSQKLALLGYEDSVLSQSKNIKRVEYRLILLTSLAHKFIINNRIQEAESIIQQAKQLVATNEPGSNDDGFRAVAEEIAHLGKLSEALEVVEKLSPDRQDWKDEGLGQVAKGLADAGLMKEAFAVLRSIRDIEHRSKEFITLINSIDNKEDKRRVVDSLLAIVPLIPDERNWKSGALVLCSNVLAEEGRISNAYSIAKSIRGPGFRYSAYQSIINKLIDAKKISEAKEVLDEIPKGTSNLAYANALIKIYKVAPDTTVKNQIIAILKKLQSQTSATREAFWERSMFSIAYSWAELGERQEALSILRDTELGFYKESTFDEFKMPIESLVKQNQDKKIYEFLIGISDTTAKCYFLIALISCSSTEEKQKLLLEAESVAVNIPDDEEQSFAYSAIAKEWAELRNLHHAMELSNQCRSFDKVYVYIKILSKILKESS